MIHTFYQGDIPLEMWEFLMIPIYLFFFFGIGVIIKTRKIKTNPEYKYFLPGLYFKAFGGLAFAFFYIFYYGGGDTIAYYESALATANLTQMDFDSGVHILFGERTVEDYFLYNVRSGYPLEFVFHDPKTFMVVRLLIPILLITFKSYILATIFIACITYFASWHLYKMFVRYYPHYRKYLTYGILFTPSTLFWGSGILKDSFTLAATCIFVVSVERFFIQKKYRIGQLIMLMLSAFLLISIKPYIFMVLLPGTFIWIFYARLSKLKSKFFVYIVVPFVVAMIFGATYLILSSLSNELGKFSLDQAFETAAISQKDLKRQEYQGNSFDIGEFEGTATGVLSKFPVAVMAGLFRPFLWESNNIAMLLSGMENLVLLGLFLLVLFKSGIRQFFRYIKSEPLLLFSVLFSLLFSFIVGISTSNFGALVRFKIPLMPFFTSSLLILLMKTYDKKANLMKKL